MKRQHRAMHSTRSIKAYAQAGRQAGSARGCSHCCYRQFCRPAPTTKSQASAHSHLAQDLWISNVALVNLVERQPLCAPLC